MKTLHKEFIIPEEYRRGIETIYQTLTRAGYQAYMVGGSVRDWLLGIEASDFDFATNARPEQVMTLFRRAIPTGIKHGTVTVLLHDIHYEITTYRNDGTYSDGRHPDSISFSESLEEDVLRRDFTINGLAYDLGSNSVIDHVDGLTDLERGTIRTIGSAMERLGEDGLRSYRACRFASRFGYAIDKDTMDAIAATLDISAKVSAERIRDELLKLLATPKPSLGIELMRATGLLQQCLPELAGCYGLSQNRFHIYDIYYHNLYSCDAAPAGQPMIRLAALLHDIGKTPTRREAADGEHTFYNHEVIGARMVKNIMNVLNSRTRKSNRCRIWSIITCSITPTSGQTARSDALCARLASKTLKT
jgi:poly(A) polymerase/tRNA nucleotidyltransferase (CCA-adding enzyme)